MPATKSIQVQDTRELCCEPTRHIAQTELSTTINITESQGCLSWGCQQTHRTTLESLVKNTIHTKKGEETNYSL